MPVDPSPHLATLIQFFEEGIPFNKHLGMKVIALDAERCRVHIPFQPFLVGDPFRPAIHGGVISTLADTAGGLAVFARVGSVAARLSTVDLRVDYYAPGPLADLYADAEVVRLGNRVAIARIFIYAGDPELFAETSLSAENKPIAEIKPIAEGKGVYNMHKRD